MEEQKKLTDMRILLAEDNQVNRMIVVAMLKKLGCQIVCAVNGFEAVEQITCNDFDLVLMDCQMPEMDGYQATQIIRKNEINKKRPRIPIIAFTASTTENDRNLCNAAGMDGYISKPVRQEDLEHIVLFWLTKKHQMEFPAKISHEEFDYNIDSSIFDSFASLMGNKLPVVLSRHRQAAKCYIDAMFQAIEKGDFQAIADAAHPLASSSGQIGAIKVSKIACIIERSAGMASPEQNQLRMLVNEISLAQREVEHEFDNYMREKDVVN